MFGASFSLAYFVSNQLIVDDKVEREAPTLSVARAAKDMMLSIREHNQLCHPTELARLSPDEIDSRLTEADQVFGEARGHFAELEFAAQRMQLLGDGPSPALAGLLRSVDRRLADYGNVAVAQAALVNAQLNPPQNGARLAPSVYLAVIYDGFHKRREALLDMQTAYDDLVDWLADPCQSLTDCTVHMAQPHQAISPIMTRPN
ncbi:MAG: hypothetical protein AAF556_05580 [Pseudomonadota bacterium]